MAPGDPSNLTFLAAGLLGLGPALAIMFYTLRHYDYPHVDKALFSDRKLFGSFAVGMILGTISAAATNILLAPASSFPAYLAILLLVAVFDEGFKLVYLNARLLRGRFDSVFYGSSLGLAMGGTSSMAFGYLALSCVEASDCAAGAPGNALPTALALSLMVALGLVGTEFFTGALLGSGAARGEMLRPFGEALASRGLVGFALALLLSPPGPEVGWGAGALAVAEGALLAWMAHSTIVPGSLPEEVRRDIRRRRRLGAHPDQTRR